ncbi:MAG TPA: helix-turn-helix domain-containing protein [Steroidobacteraceae bacterium]|nr:helix-turn-helix domain-containing protein [Steroidobacteraceae bacterium]
MGIEYMARASVIPVFYLFGEPHRSAGERFVHLEQLHDRSRPNNWTIRAHAHSELTHLFMIRRGGGVMRAEDRTLNVEAPSLLVIPAGVVHSFKWHWESRGSVLTLADIYLQQFVTRDKHIAELFQMPRAIELAAEDLPHIESRLLDLTRELSWAARGYRAAIDSAVLAIIVTALRRAEQLIDLRAVSPGHHAALVARFRHSIEKRFRLREAMSVHAKALGVSETTLRLACAKIAGMSPGAILDQRALLEAKRALLYSNRSIAEIGFQLGFVDAAYFSRFFRTHAGSSPRAYRADGINGRYTA